MAHTNADPSLVGRPLVPFFTPDERLNETLGHVGAREAVDVDARRWNPEGFFEYADEAGPAPAGGAPAATQTPSKRNKKKNAAAPAATPAAVEAFKARLRQAVEAGGGAVNSSAVGMLPGWPEVKRATGGLRELVAATAGLKLTERQGGAVVERAVAPTVALLFGQDSPPAAPGPPSTSPVQTPPPPAQSTRKGGKKGRGAATAQPQSVASPAPSSAKGGKKGGKKGAKKGPAQPAAFAWSAFQSSPDPKSLPMPSFTAASLAHLDDDDDDEALSPLSGFPSLLTPPSGAGPASPGFPSSPAPPAPVAAPAAAPAPAPAIPDDPFTAQLKQMLNIA